MADRSFLRWPFFDDRQRRLADEIESWCERHLDDGAAAADVDETCRALVAKLAAGRWLEWCAPRIDGEFATPDVRSLCLIREALARRLGLAEFVFAMQGLGSGPITLFGDAALKRRYLEAVRNGEAIAAFALSEPEAGSDVAALAASAVRDGGDWIIDGDKTWISNGGIADFYIVFARSGEAPGARGLSAFVVDAGTPGLEVASRIDVIAPHPLAGLRLHRCRVPGDRLLGEAGAGFKVAMATLDVFRPTVAAAALGFARRALDETLAHTTRRRLFGEAMAELAVVRARLAEMATDIDAAALLVYRAAWLHDTGSARITREASMAKWHATEAAQRVIDAAVQLHGGHGVVSGHPVERLYRQVRALRIYEGASEIQQQIIARQLVDGFRAAAHDH